MLINLSNHPLGTWSDLQKSIAMQAYGEIKDIPFPDVDPEASEEDIQSLADTYCQTILQIGSPSETIIHIMGEMTFSFAMVQLLKNNGYTCIASTTERDVVETAPETKLATFHFVRFRLY